MENKQKWIAQHSAVGIIDGRFVGFPQENLVLPGKAISRKDKMGSLLLHKNDQVVDRIIAATAKQKAGWSTMNFLVFRICTAIGWQSLVLDS